METPDPLPPNLFSELVQTLRESLQPPPVTSSASACPMAKPVTCSGFLLQCSLYFEMQPHQFVSYRAKIAFIMSLLSGRALQWAESIWNSRSPVVRSLNTFVDQFREVFGTSTSAISVHNELFRKQECPFMTTPFVSALLPRPAVGMRSHSWQLIDVV